MESAIELDDDALVEVTDPEIPLVPSPSVSPPSVPRPAPASMRPEAPGLLDHQDDLVVELARRAQVLENSGTPVALSRALVELSMALDAYSGDRGEALAQARKACEVAPDVEAAIFVARWFTPARPLGPALELVQTQARLARDDPQRLTRALQTAELYRNASRLEDAQAFYRQALSIQPAHPGALRGCESVLQAQFRVQTGVAPALGGVLEDMASAFTAEPTLSAWLHVERAALLNAAGKHDAARAALELAMAQAFGNASVRYAYARHLWLQRSTEALVNAWSRQAATEPDASRAARLEYAAGRLASEKLEDANLAITLHARAAERTQAPVDTRQSALQELARLHAELGRPRGATEAREKLLELVQNPARRCHEHRRLSETYELLGDHDSVVRHCHQLLAVDADDRASRDRLDRALQALNRHHERVEYWTSESARLAHEKERADALVRAARIAETKLRDVKRAESLYRAAWACDSSNTDAFDGLASLLAHPQSSDNDAHTHRARERIDLYEQAAILATDKERRIACLEKVAIIWEDELRHPTRAMDAYRRIVELDDRRRSALLGLQRCANLAGQVDVLVQTLVKEADIVQDPSLQRTLLLRAAHLTADEIGDADAAMQWIGRVLARSPGDPLALRAAWYVNRQTGRIEQAVEQLRLLLKHTRKGPAAFSLCMEMAALLEEQLHRPLDAVQAYRDAARHDPEHPAPPIEIPRILLSLGEHRKAAEMLMDLASQMSHPHARSRLLVQAAEIFDDRLDDLDAALMALTQALALVPSDAASFERLVWVQERRGKPTELTPVLEKRIAASSNAEKLMYSMQLAELQQRQRDHAKAAALLQTVVEQDPRQMPALRMLEHSLRKLERWEELAHLLHHEANVTTDPQVKLGALWEALYYETLAAEGAAEKTETALATIEELLVLAPHDLAVHEALLRWTGLPVQGPWGRKLASSLAQLAVFHAADSFLSGILHLAAAWKLEALGEQEDAAATRQALGHYRACLKQWPHSLTAARGLLRIAQTVGENEIEVEAHLALAKIEAEAKIRAAHRAAAAEALALQNQPGRSFDLFVDALRDDPDNPNASQGLIALLDRGVDAGHLADTLRKTLDSAHDIDQVVLVGGAMGRIARDVLNDPNGAVEAFRKVRDRAPGHVPSLLELAEACVALQLWFEAAEVAQSVLGLSNQPPHQLQAMLVLAEAHAHTQPKWAEARQKAAEAESRAERLQPAERKIVVARLALVHEALGDNLERDRLINLSIVLSGSDLSAFHALSTRHDTSTVEGCIAYMQQLNNIVSLSEAMGLPQQPAWLVEMGRLEALRLSRPREGLGKLREAMALEPSRVETVLSLSGTLATLGAHEEAATELRSWLFSVEPATITTEKMAHSMTALHRELVALGRRPQALVADEILAFLGIGPAERTRAYRSRTLAEPIPQPMAFDRAMLENHLIPAAGQGALLQIAAVLDEAAPKLLRLDPSGLASTSAARLSARSNHPRRALVDRLARAFGAIPCDVYVDVPSLTTPRIIPATPTALLLPPGYDQLPIMDQAVGLTRLLFQAALGVAWLDELNNEDLTGWLFGALAVGRPGWDGGGLHPSKQGPASTWRPTLQKTLSRKARGKLDDIAEEARLDMDPIAWRFAIHLASWRCAYVVTADWTASIHHAWRSNRDLAGVAAERMASSLLAHPVLRDITLWGLSAETTPLLRAVGHGG